MSDIKKPSVLSFAVSAAISVSIGSIPSVSASDNPFAVQDLKSGYMQFVESNCGEGNCGGDSAKDDESNCGEGNCGDDSAKNHESNCGEGNCGGDSAKNHESNCGEGNCGGR